jgi:hypothetical protein
VGVLTGDLDCTNPGFIVHEAVRLTHGSRLRLNGFILTHKSIGVTCEGTCGVNGPGTVRGPAPPQLPDGNCTGTHAISGNKVKLTDVHLENFSWGAIGSSRVRAKRITIDSCCFGISTYDARVVESNITDNAGFGVRGIDRVVVRGSNVTGQLTDLISLNRPRVRRSTCGSSGNGSSPAGEDFWAVCSGP